VGKSSMQKSGMRYKTDNQRDRRLLDEQKDPHSYS
jgi:hypothetical protein